MGFGMFIDWIAVQALATSMLVATSIGAIGYAGLQLRHERGYRSVASLEKQLGFFLSEPFVAARRRLALARLETVDNETRLRPWELDQPPVAVFEILDFYEHLALLVKKGHLEIYDVWHTFYEWAQPVYVDMQSLIESADSMYTDHYRDLRKMMHRMNELQLKRMQRKNADHLALLTPDRIVDHYRYELESGGRPLRSRHVEAREVAREVVREIQQADPATMTSIGNDNA